MLFLAQYSVIRWRYGIRLFAIFISKNNHSLGIAQRNPGMNSLQRLSFPDSATLRPGTYLIPRHRHLLYQYRTALHRAALNDVVTDGDDLFEHVFEIPGDGDFFYGVLDFAVLDPVARCAARVIAGDHVDALP